MKKPEYNKKRLQQYLAMPKIEIKLEQQLDLLAFDVTPHLDEELDEKLLSL